MFPQNRTNQHGWGVMTRQERGEGEIARKAGCMAQDFGGLGKKHVLYFSSRAIKSH